MCKWVLCAIYSGRYCISKRPSSFFTPLLLSTSSLLSFQGWNPLFLQVVKSILAKKRRCEEARYESSFSLFAQTGKGKHWKLTGNFLSSSPLQVPFLLLSTSSSSPPLHPIWFSLLPLISFARHICISIKRRYEPLVFSLPLSTFCITPASVHFPRRLRRTPYSLAI